jgi:hypothetical protein
VPHPTVSYFDYSKQHTNHFPPFSTLLIHSPDLNLIVMQEVKVVDDQQQMAGVDEVIELSLISRTVLERIRLGTTYRVKEEEVDLDNL